MAARRPAGAELFEVDDHGGIDHSPRSTAVSAQSLLVIEVGIKPKLSPGRSTGLYCVPIARPAPVEAR